jgi:hypothetical protein
MRKCIIVAAGLAVAACASTSDRITSELVAAGLDQTRAQCLGRSLQRDLSISQLRQLANAAQAYQSNDTTPGRLTLSDLVRTTAPIQDRAVPIAVAKAAAACA